MDKGRPPVGPDGEDVILHHMTQRQKGAIVEVTTTMHARPPTNRILHINGNDIRSGIDRPKFRSWRRQYWMNRYHDFAGE